MTRKEFVKVYADAVANQRKKNFPDIRMSEAIMARIDDEANARKHWTRHRATFARMTPADFQTWLTQQKELPNG